MNNHEQLQEITHHIYIYEYINCEVQLADNKSYVFKSYCTLYNLPLETNQAD